MTNARTQPVAMATLTVATLRKLMSPPTRLCSHSRATSSGKSKDHAPDVIRVARNATFVGIRGFALAYAIRSGVSFLQRLLARRKKSQRISQILRAAFMSSDTARLAALFGIFPFVFHASLPLLEYALARSIKSTATIPYNDSAISSPANSEHTLVEKDEKNQPLSLLDDNLHDPRKRRRLAAFIAGVLAGYLSILVATPANRLTFAQQMSMRALQAIYNMLKSRDMFHFPLGDSLLFVLSCAQIMFAYIHYPDTLPKEFYTFMVDMARIPRNILQMNRESVRGKPIDVTAFKKWVTSPISRITPTSTSLNYLTSLQSIHAIASAAVPPSSSSSSPMYFPVLPCHIIHPQSDSCTWYCVWLANDVFRKIFPVYFSLHLVPMVLLKFREVSDRPFELLLRGLVNTLRSCSFLAVYITSYQILICLQRILITRHNHSVLPLSATTTPLSFINSLTSSLWRSHKLSYFFFGLSCSLAILVEDKRRRSELGLYVVPKAIHSLYQICMRRKILPHVKHLNVAVFALSMGAIMAVYETEPERLSTMIARIMKRFV